MTQKPLSDRPINEGDVFIVAGGKLIPFPIFGVDGGIDIMRFIVSKITENQKQAALLRECANVLDWHTEKAAEELLEKLKREGYL